MYISNDRESSKFSNIYSMGKPQFIEYDKICNGLKALSEILSIYSYIIKRFDPLEVVKHSKGETMDNIIHCT